MPKLPELFLPALLLLLLCAGVKGGESAAAPPPDAAILDATALGELPAMVNGRIMPLDTLARTSMLQLAGISTWKYSIPDPENPGETKTVRRPAIDWFAQVLMTPYETRNDKIFLVNFPDVGEALGLEHDGGRMRYSFSDITGSIEKLEEVIRGAIDKEANDRTQLENEMGKLNAALRHFVSYTKAFMYTSEHPNFSFKHEANQNALGLPIKDQYSFVEIFRCSPLISARLANAKPLPKDMTPEDLELFQINQELQTWTRELGQIQFGLLPLQAHGEIVWMNPLQAATIPGAHTVVAQDLEGLSEIARCYQNQDQAGFDRAVQAFKAATASRLDAKSDVPPKVKQELSYNTRQPFTKAETLYGIGLLLSLIAVAANRKKWWMVPLAFCIVAWLIQTFGIGQRMYIMGRPPITNLYATFLFVSWAAVLIGILIECFSKRGIATLASCSTGMILLLVASARSFSSEDTMAPLVAVLNSNFWLATHVIAINLGYVGAAFAGIFGMIYLGMRIFLKDKHADMKLVHDCIYGVLAFGLIFSFLGTMLGGVWADQSWGRFWGWDPKENGALLVVIWCGVLFHSRMSNLISAVGFAAGSVLGMIVVLFAWLGVNLLGVGLHSYGFTSGVEQTMNYTMLGLLLFVILTVFIIKLKDIATRPARRRGSSS